MAPTPDYAAKLYEKLSIVRQTSFCDCCADGRQNCFCYCYKCKQRRNRRQRSTPAHDNSDSAFYGNYNSSSLIIILAVIKQDQRQGQYFSRHLSYFYSSNIYMYQS